MTKATKPKDKDLKKPTPRRRGSTGGGGSPALNSGFQTASMDNRCMIIFRATLVLEKPDQLDRSSDLTLLPDAHSSTKIDILQNSRLCGEYTGANIDTMLACMKLGYTYRAKIIRLDPTGVVIEVRGEGA